jgi:hypothetical protein
MVYSTCNSRARNNFSGGIEGRPTREYIREKTRESRCNTLSVICPIARSGWSAGTRSLSREAVFR